MWCSSPSHSGCVLFSSLENNAGLLTASGKLWHLEKPTAEETFNSTIKYIRNVKLVAPSNLQLALKDIATCNWALMHVAAILTEPDPQRKVEARRAFRVFGGTSHLFQEGADDLSPVTFTAGRSREVRE